MTRIAFIASQVAAVIAVILLWELLAATGAIDVFYFGRPSRVGEVLGGWFADGSIYTELLLTFLVLILGWAIGMILGILIGSLLFRFSFLRQVATPFLAFANGVPRMVFYPFFGLWLGFSLSSKVGLVVFVIIFFVIINVMSGLSRVDVDLVSHVRVIGGGPLKLIIEVYFPSIVDWMINSSRVTIAFALQATLISEFFGPAEGIGSLLVRGQGTFQINEVWAALAITVVFALAIDLGLMGLGRRLTAWSRAR